MHVIKSIRDLNFFMKKTLKSKKTLFEIRHTRHNYVDLDENYDYSSSSSSASSSDYDSRGLLERTMDEHPNIPVDSK